jgi:hypothetical protein
MSIFTDKERKEWFEQNSIDDYSMPRKPASEWTREERIEFRQHQAKKRQRSFDRIAHEKQGSPLSEKIAHHDKQFEYYCEQIDSYVPLGAYAHLMSSIKCREVFIKNKYCK